MHVVIKDLQYEHLFSRLLVQVSIVAVELVHLAFRFPVVAVAIN